MEHAALHLTTPADVVLALYDACREADAAVRRGNDSGALDAMRSMDDLVANDAPFHRMELDRVRTGPITDVRRVLGSRSAADRIVVHGAAVVVFSGGDALDVFEVANGRVAEGWCLIRSQSPAKNASTA